MKTISAPPLVVSLTVIESCAMWEAMEAGTYPEKGYPELAIERVQDALGHVDLKFPYVFFTDLDTLAPLEAPMWS